MAVIKRGILGGFSKSIGNVVGSSWKGVAYMKAKPLSVANPNSVGQQAQRGAFTVVTAQAKALLSTIIQVLWNPIIQGMSGYNYFTQTNIGYCATGGISDFPNFKTTLGNVTPAVQTPAVASAGANTIDVNWTDNTGEGNAQVTDTAIIAIYNETQDYWVSEVTIIQRGATTLQVSDTVMAQNDQLHIYLSFSKSVKNCSIPNYAQALVGA